MLLINKDTDETRIIKAGPVLYPFLLFIPIVGNVAFLVMAILQKQFKGLWLNLRILPLILTIPIVTLLMYFSGTSIYNIAITIILFLYLTAYFAMFGLLVVNGNYYSYLACLERGYKIANEDTLTDKERRFIEIAKTKKPKPAIIFFNF